jgi:membrane peptidoglycan carboxypeptidase
MKSSYFAPLLRAGLITGICVAAVAFPLAAVGGLGILAGTDFIQSLPDTLRVAPSAQVTKIYASDGVTPITQFYEEYRKYVSISDISPNMLKAIVASEDSRFYDHHGVDTRGVLRAFLANRQSDGVSQGASTLTMQYVRNVQRDSATTPQEVTDATAQTNVRKLKEMRLAVSVEKQLSKEQILERYLNVAYFGHRAYGIYAAAEVFFSKSPKDLTLAESATLAGLVKAPTAYDPAGPDKTAALDRRNYVIDRMSDIKYLSPGLADQLKKQPIQLKLTDPPNDCISVSPEHNDWGFFCDMFKNWWDNQPAFGKTPQERDENLRRGGYTVVTSLDPKMQAVAMSQVTSQERIGSSYALGLVGVQPGTGKIQTAAVNRKYSLNQTHNGPVTDYAKANAGVVSSYPNTVAPLLGGGQISGYQAGSTFKIFTMTAALDQGLPLNTPIMSPLNVKTIYLTGDDDPSRCGGPYWCPHSASAAMVGVQTMWSGFGKSVNTYFVQLEERIGAANAVKMAEKLGLTWHNDVDKRLAQPEFSNGWGSFTLGVADTTPLEMANAYATLAADGLYCEASPVLKITDSSGKPVAAAAPNCHQVVRPEVARAAVDATRCTTGYGAATGGCGGWSTAPGVYGAVGRPVGGKTGTTDETRAAWFVGLTPDLAAASFIADPDNPYHVAGDWNSQKPVNAVAGLLKNGLAGLPIRQFSPPTAQTAQHGAGAA